MSHHVEYALSNTVIIAKEAPYTYFIPSAEARNAARVGDSVKLVFEWHPPVEKYSTERMWVKITATEGSSLQGKLDNQPYEKGKLQRGDVILFHPDNILDIDWNEPNRAVIDPPERQYWERCLVDDCVLDGSQPVEYIYRETPDMTGDGDKFPDSGWRIRGRVRCPEDYDNREFSYVALGVVLNKDDSWLPLLDAPEGSRFMRDFSSGQYERCREE